MASYKRDKNQTIGTSSEKDFSGLKWRASVIEKQYEPITESEKIAVSEATVRNWEKLNTQLSGRLTARANKRRSQKRILPVEYISNKENIACIQNILDHTDEKHLDIMSVLFSLGINLLKKSNIYQKKHVANVLGKYADVAVIEELLAMNLPTDEFDLLGVVYQSYLYEGRKNIIGSYYTPPKITSNMTKNFDLSGNKLFLDPCCGSGAFLLSVKADDPNQLYGVDTDQVAVLIAEINLLLKYKDIEFVPQIYCLDFLRGGTLLLQHQLFQKKFDYIATNPPWGAMEGDQNSRIITSKETFSYFFVKAFSQLKAAGTVRFLFPEAILNVKVHRDIRKFIIDRAGLVSITVYDDMFSGVTTKYVDIECTPNSRKDKFDVYTENHKRSVDIRSVYETDNLIFNLLSDEIWEIVRIVKAKGKYSLNESIWALGIVTGDNKGKLFPQCHSGMEKIYTGKEIQPYVLHNARNYILYDRANLQQVAKEEIYRAPEKLVYKFISNKLVFAYDNSASLFLNSGNILIPNIPKMSIKTVMAFLNSSLFQFMYMKLFGEVKILKGNLIELPFPEISEYDDQYISSLVDGILSGDDTRREIVENYIFSIYGLTEKQINHIRKTVTHHRRSDF